MTKLRDMGLGWHQASSTTLAKKAHQFLFRHDSENGTWRQVIISFSWAPFGDALRLIELNADTVPGRA